MRVLPLGHKESVFLETLHTQRRLVTVNTDILTDGDEMPAVLIVSDGWAFRYKLLAHGRCQILTFILLGDTIGSTASLFTRATCPVQALTDVRLCTLKAQHLAEIARDFPKLAWALESVFRQEESMLAEQVVRIGRRTAYERLAHLLLELLLRLQAVGHADRASYDLPLTQEVLADALGLSGVHVNRTLRQLRTDGLIHLKDRRIIIGDVERLTEVAEFEPAYLQPVHDPHTTRPYSLSFRQNHVHPNRFF
ncbi:MAG: Crp-type transcriptional activatory protein [Rhodospirillaceae bacterium]|nr:MAG: Crp-type transcriptional activatory protein [Rhodospirillaceae bacterium]